ncbi:MAG: hypothetical protein K2L21_07405, partial [Muribaculaceae bacterium]|nr:hypothetical protein [Muribaculaceae bacterium]
VVFIFYMWFMILSSRSEKVEPDATPAAASEVGIALAHKTAGEFSMLKIKFNSLRSKIWFSWLMIAAGLGALVVGGNWVVDGAGGLALKVGMSQGMVALTVIAIGNALPDLVTSLTATLKGASGIALGNIVGSCIINALLSIGLSALVIPLKADSIGFVDFATLAGAAALIWLVPLFTKDKRMTRAFGIILVLLYVAYMAFTVVRG